MRVCGFGFGLRVWGLRFSDAGTRSRVKGFGFKVLAVPEAVPEAHASGMSNIGQIFGSKVCRFGLG